MRLRRAWRGGPSAAKRSWGSARGCACSLQADRGGGERKQNKTNKQTNKKKKSWVRRKWHFAKRLGPGARRIEAVVSFPKSAPSTNKRSCRLADFLNSSMVSLSKSLPMNSIHQMLSLAFSSWMVVSAAAPPVSVKSTSRRRMLLAEWRQRTAGAHRMRMNAPVSPLVFFVSLSLSLSRPRQGPLT